MADASSRPPRNARSTTTKFVVARDDPGRADVLSLLVEHLADMHATSSPESAHALDPAALTHPSITLWSARDETGALLGVGALKQHDAQLGEIKSMRTTAAARGRGIASAMLATVIAECAARGIRELALETSAEPSFAAAHSLYRRHGFIPCGPFADYSDDPNSLYLTRAV